MEPKLPSLQRVNPYLSSTQAGQAMEQAHHRSEKARSAQPDSPRRWPGNHCRSGNLPVSRPVARTPTDLTLAGLSPARSSEDEERQMPAAGRYRYAMVCSSNMNRSMEAHLVLTRAGLDVASYGTGAHVKLPGPSLHEPNVYAFGTPYSVIYDDLRRKDPDLYVRNGLLPMLKRNIAIKTAPQRWQENADDGPFDVVFTFEERVFDAVLEDLESREQRLLKNVLMINMDVKDNHEEACLGAKLALEVCQRLEAVNGWEDTIDDIVTAFEKQYKRKIVYSISYY